MAITVQCTCGKTLKIDDKHRGKKAKCPVCGDTVLVEDSPAQTSVTEKPRKRVAAADDSDDGGDAPEIRKPLKRQAGKNKMMVYMIGGGCAILLLMTCCLSTAGFGIWYFWFSGPPDDLIYVHDGVTGFLTYRVADVWKNPTVQDQLKNFPGGRKEMDEKLKEMEGKLGLRVDDVERATVILGAVDFDKFGRDPPDMVVSIKTSKAMDHKKIIDVIVKESRGNKKEEEVKFDGGTIYTIGGGRDAIALYWPSNRVVLLSPKVDSIKDIVKQSKKTAKNPALVRGISMASGSKYHFVMAANLSKLPMNKIPDDAWAKVPGLKDMNGMVLASSFSKDVATMEAIITFPTRDKAEKGKKEVDELKSMANGFIKIGVPNPPPALTKFMDSITITQSGAEVIAKAKIDMDLNALGGAGGMGFPNFPKFGGGGFGPGAANRIASVNNLKQIGLAMHAHQAVFNRLPKTSETNLNPNAAGLSWRVKILPYIEQQALYNQIRLDEPWNSQHNSQFHNRMPQTYVLPGRPNDGRTYYQVFRGNETAFPAARNLQVRLPADITDGSSNTILVVEAATPVSWMQPDNDIFFNANDNFLMARLGNHWGENTFNAVMGDGLAVRLRRDMPAQTLRGLITRAGGENVNFNDWVK